MREIIRYIIEEDFMSNEHGGWASPAPAGLTALAVACFTFFAVLTGKVPGSVVPMLGCWLVGGFVVQFVVALVELKEGHLLGGNIFLFFSAFFMLTGGLEFFVKTNAAFAAFKPTSDIDGWAWLVLTATLILWTPAYLKTTTTALGLTVIVIDVAVVFVTLKDLALMPAATAGPVAGWALFIVGCLAIYIAAAIQLNAAWGKTILPLGGPIIKNTYSHSHSA
jgi:succinate-acetate transporter protein